jgi:integrase
MSPISRRSTAKPRRSEAWALQVVGRLRKQRLAPLDDKVVEWIRRRLGDQRERGVAMPRCPALPCPALVGSLASPPPRWTAGSLNRCCAARCCRSGCPTAASTVASGASLLARRRRPAAPSSIVERLLQDSTAHHTFGGHAVARGGQTDAVQNMTSDRSR